jgi:hypothetical protein
MADSRGGKRVSDVDHKDGDDSPTMDSVDLREAVVVQGLDLGPTSLDPDSVSFLIFENQFFVSVNLSN